MAEVGYMRKQNLRYQATDLPGLLEQYARVLRMRNGTSVSVQRCIKIDGFQLREGDNPLDTMNIQGAHALFEFAIGIIEDRPVFRGDTLYYKDTGNSVTLIDELEAIKIHCPLLTWTKPKTTNTVVVNGVSIEAPRCTNSHPEYNIHIGGPNEGAILSFGTKEDANKALGIIVRIFK